MMRYLLGMAALLHAASSPAMQALPPAPLSAEQAVADARLLVEQLAKRDFSAVVRHGDARIQAALPAEKLGAVWDALNAQFGAFQHQGEARSAEAEGGFVVTIPCVFAKAVLDARIAYGGSGKVGGLHFVPSAAASSQPENTSWSVPSYLIGTHSRNAN